MQRIRRLLRMPAREIAYRTAEQFWGVKERAASRRSLAVLAREAPGIETAAPSHRFFFRDADEDREALRADFAARFPREQSALMRRADAARSGTLRIFGREVTFPGGHVDWHRDWETGEAYPRAFYRDIPVFDEERVADRKRVWELNRQQYLVTLGQAYFVSRDESYACSATHLITSWIEQNPPYIGFNWREALEVALRLLSWTFTLRLLEGHALPRDTGQAILASIDVQYTFIRRHLSLYASPNTHILGEALALFVVGHEYPQLRDAGPGTSHALEILGQELENQFGEDGSHFEKSAYYHAYAVEMLLLAFIHARQRGDDRAAHWRPKLERISAFLSGITRPDGRLVRFGDDDGGRTIRLGDDDLYDARPLLALAATLFERADFKRAAGEPTPDVWWLLGPSGAMSFDELPVGDPGPAWAKFPDAGIVVLRDGFEPTSSWVAAQASPFGAMTAGHSHGGLLSFEAHLDGQLVFADPGTFSYGEGDAWRDALRRVAAHNTVGIDDHEWWVIEDTFRWRPRVSLETVTEVSSGSAGVGYRAAEAAGDPIGHRRQFRLDGESLLRIVDEFDGRGRHRLSYRLPLAPGWMVEPAGDSTWSLARGETRLELSLRDFGATTFSVQEGGLDPIVGWYSDRFGHRQAAPVLLIEEGAVAFPARREIRVSRGRAP